MKALLFFIASLSFALEYSGEITLENRFYFEEGLYGNTERGDSSLGIKPEFTYSWDQDRKVINFTPYAKLSQLDSQKTHADIRELSFVGAWGDFELRAGISKVFWGVTESLHLVDVINQIDLVENIDGEDRLGQPMINPTYISSYGSFSYFFLPYFRERTFSGTNGRLRAALPVDTDNPVFRDSDEEKHIDHAFRYSHYIGSFDFALSYFTGTDREPTFVTNSNLTRLLPVYEQTEQWGLELQYIYEDLLIKSEVLRKDSTNAKPFLATVTGFEYTFGNIHQGMDIGLLYEWIYDERNESAAFLDDASFVGTRIALNDENSTEFLAGGFIDNYNGELASFRLESSRRINENFKWEFEVNMFSAPRKDTLLDQIRKDDYAQFSLSYFY